MCPILLRNKIVVLRSAFLGIRYLESGFQMPTPSSGLANGHLKPRGPTDAIACRASILSPRCQQQLSDDRASPADDLVRDGHAGQQQLSDGRALSELLGECLVRTRSGNDVLDPNVVAVRRGVVRIVERHAGAGAS